MAEPIENKPYRVTGPGWNGWGVAYWGAAKTPSDPAAEHSTRKCWRWCQDEDPINSTVALFKEYEPPKLHTPMIKFFHRILCLSLLLAVCFNVQGVGAMPEDRPALSAISLPSVGDAASIAIANQAT